MFYTDENQTPPGALIETVNLKDYWRIIMNRRWLVLAVFLVIVVAVFIKSVTTVPVYRATSQILIERANPNILRTEELFAIDPSGQDFYQTQYKVIESRSLARRVIEETGLARQPEFTAPQKQAEGIVATVTEKLTGWYTTVKDAVFARLRPKPPEPPAVSFSLDDANLPADPADRGIVTAFQRRLTVDPLRNSRLVNVSFDSASPALAATVANAAVQAYIDWNLGLRLKGQQEASRFLDEQVKTTKRKLEAAEAALQQYREKYGVAVLGSQVKSDEGATDLSRQKMSKVNDQLLEATNRRISAEINYRKAASLVGNSRTAETIPQAVGSPVIVAIKNQEVALMREKAEKAQKYGPKHPVMMALNEEIEKIQNQKYQEIRTIVDALRSEYEIAVQQEQSLKTALGVSQDETISRDKIAIQYQMLRQEAATNRNLYDMLLKRYKEASVSEENRTVNVHVIDRAEIPGHPIRPRVKRDVLLAGLIGIFLGIGLAFFLEYLDDSVTDTDQFAVNYGTPILGKIPHFSSRNGGRASKSDIVLVTEPRSPVSESYRSLRTSILFSQSDHRPASFIVTSATSAEGKTVTAANLAVATAHAGTRVALIDCDMRKSRLHDIFNIKGEEGLTNVLVGECEWQDVITPIKEVTNLSVIPAGPHPPNPAELLGSERMQKTVAELIAAHDQVIIDTAPIMAVTDPVILSRLVDGVVIVVKTGETNRHQLRAAVQNLADVHARVLGAVLNDIDHRKSGYYSSRYYSYYYYGTDHTKKRSHATSTTEHSAGGHDENHPV